jgi:hypothetical protein
MEQKKEEFMKSLKNFKSGQVRKRDLEIHNDLDYF